MYEMTASMRTEERTQGTTAAPSAAVTRPSRRPRRGLKFVIAIAVVSTRDPKLCYGLNNNNNNNYTLVGVTIRH